MTDRRRDRLELALRRNRGRQQQSAYLEDMESRLGRRLTGLDLIDLRETDAVRAALERRIESMLDGTSGTEINAVGVDTDQRQIVERFVLAALALWRPEPEVFLLGPGSDVCGAVPTSASEVRRHGLSLVRDDEEAALIGDRSGGVGLKIYADTVAGHAPRRWSVLGWSTTLADCPAGEGRAVAPYPYLSAQ